MKNSLLDLKNILVSNKKGALYLIIYVLFTTTITCILHSGIDRIYLSKNYYSYLSILITFFTNIIWNFLFIGAVNYSDLLLNKKDVNIISFFDFFKKPWVLKSALFYGLIISFLSILNTNLIQMLSLQINWKITGSTLRILNDLLSVLVIYFEYRIMLLPYIIISNSKFIECIKISFRMTKQYKYTVKWFILLGIIPGFLGIILFSVLTPILSHVYLFLVQLHISRDAFLQSAPEVIILIFYPVQIFGYQICFQHFDNRSSIDKN